MSVSPEGGVTSGKIIYPFHPGYISGNWYNPLGAITVSGVSGNPAINTIKSFPFVCPSPVSITTVACRVVVDSAGTNVQFAIYSANPTTLKPTGNPLSSTASLLLTGTAGTNPSVAYSNAVDMKAGNLYWFACNIDSNTPTFATACGGFSMLPALIGSSTQTNNFAGAGVTWTGYSTAQTFGTWPDLTAASFTDVTSSSIIPFINFKVA